MMEEKTPRKRRQQQTKYAILEAARRIIREQGASQLSMRAIAEAIDYSPAGLYEYFGSKEEIIHAVCRQGHGFLHQALLSVDAALPPSDRVVALGQAYIRFALENPESYLLMFTLAGSSADPVEMVGEESAYTVLVGAIQQGLESGVFTARPAFGQQEMAYAAWALVHGIAMLRLTHLRNFPADFAAADEEALAAFARGLKGESQG
jgi:AcrR family transcriptional regulator